MSLKQCYFDCMGPLAVKNCYFFGFRVVEEVYLVVTGGSAILGFTIFYLLFMLSFCYD